jgi:hypothetical protein
MKRIISSPDGTTIVNFRRKDVGDTYVIFITEVEQIRGRSDNTPVLDAQIEGLETAIRSLKEQKEKDKNE